jgi:quercetin dioxygenase-like cupin family protein
MNSVRTMAVATLIACSTLAMHAAQAQMMPGIGRVDLAKQDLVIPGREVVQVRVDFGHGAAAPRHSHPGEEVAFVLEGTLEYQIDGQPPVILKAGQTLFIPAGAVHSAKNVGAGESKELATYIVEKGKPLLVKAK